MVSKHAFWLIAVSGLAPMLSGVEPRIAPVPSDPLEIVTGNIKSADKPARRKAAADLLARARNSYGLRYSGRAYDLKVTFTVDSGGQTDYDGAWQMEDVFDPQQGLRWTARMGAAYSITEIISNEVAFGDGTGDHIPLRLQEARAALLDPMPAAGNVQRSAIRTSKAFYNGVELSCVLLSGAGNRTAAGRQWDETEECIDPKSGLLQVHSQIPGRYYAYDYSNAPQLDGRMLPHKVIVTEAGKKVSEITVQSLTEIPGADPSLFIPTEAMKQRGRAVVMGPMQRISRFSGPGPFAAGTTAQPVCIFGLVTPSGQLVEAHSLQPTDPNSNRALEAAKLLDFSPTDPSVRRPQQHFVFIIEKFVSQ